MPVLTGPSPPVINLQMGGWNMPVYDYKCDKCGHRFSQMVTIEERKNVSCPECRSKEVKQIITGCAINTGGCGSSPPAHAGGG